MLVHGNSVSQATDTIAQNYLQISVLNIEVWCGGHSEIIGETYCQQRRDWGPAERICERTPPATLRTAKMNTNGGDSATGRNDRNSIRENSNDEMSQITGIFLTV